MVEGDLVDLTLPNLLHALSREGSTAVLRVQRGDDRGALYFAEGALVHALANQIVGDQAVQQLLRWPDGRFRLTRDADCRPHTITHPLDDFLEPPSADGSSASGSRGAAVDAGADERLLTELLGLLTRLEHDRARLAEGRTESGTAALVRVTALVNSLVAFVTARSSDPGILPSRVLSQLAEAMPYTQLLGEDRERISIATAAALLKTWTGAAADRRSMFQDICRALIDVLAVYGSTISTFFHQAREREEWRATFNLFVNDLRTAVQQITI